MTKYEKLPVVTIDLTDATGLSENEGTAWVAGWINGGSPSHFKVLTASGDFGAVSSGGVPFFKVSSIPTVTLVEHTNGNDRLLFVVSKAQPTDLQIKKGDTPIQKDDTPIQYAQFPYAGQPGTHVAPPGPFDVFEFGMNAQFDVSAVSGFGLNLSFTAKGSSYGVDTSVSRSQIATAYKSFVANENAPEFEELLYTEALTKSDYMPPMIDNEFFAICDPNDMLVAKSGNYGSTTSDPLATYWDKTVMLLFTLGNQVSISDGTENYKGTVIDTSKLNSPPTVPANCTPFAFEFTINSTKKYIFCPEAGLQTARFVFQQSGFTTPDYGKPSTQILSQLQNSLIEALCRGVALDGVMTGPPKKGFSTTKWNDYTNWYKAGSVCHYYAKFLHCSDIDGNDSRLTGKSSIFYGGAAYGFSMDEDPMGPYHGPNVPSKTPSNIGSGTVSVTVGPWKRAAAKPSSRHQPTSGTYEFGIGDHSDELGPIKIGDYVYTQGPKGGFGGYLPDLPNWTKMEFTGLGPDYFIWIKNDDYAAGGCLSEAPVWNKTRQGGKTIQWGAKLKWVPGKVSPAKPQS